MARYLFQLSDHRSPSVLALLRTAGACRRRGDEVVFFLSNDGAYVANPEKYMVGQIKEQVLWLIANGTYFYLIKEDAEPRDIDLKPNMDYASFDQLAAEMPSFDHVLFC